jgi:methyl-accepting chemotaxis protein
LFAGHRSGVVASEVKALASQTAKATDDIKVKVRAVQGAASQAASIIGRIARTVSEIVAGASSVAAAITEQGAATDEISRNIHEAAGKTRGVSAAVADMTSNASGELHASSSELARQAEGLREAIDIFLGAMHSAIAGAAGPAEAPAEVPVTAASAGR